MAPQSISLELLSVTVALPAIPSSAAQKEAERTTALPTQLSKLIFPRRPLVPVLCNYLPGITFGSCKLAQRVLPSQHRPTPGSEPHPRFPVQQASGPPAIIPSCYMTSPPPLSPPLLLDPVYHARLPRYFHRQIRHSRADHRRAKLIRRGSLATVSGPPPCGREVRGKDRD